MTESNGKIQVSQGLERLHRIARKITLRMASAVVVVSVLVLIGWQLDIELFKRIVPVFVAMNPMTAVALICAALSLALVSRQRSVAGMWCAATLATMTLLIGTVKMFAILGQPWMDVGIDRMLFAAQLEVDSGELSNRMAPNTALCFMLIGASLLIFSQVDRVRNGVAVAQSLAISCGLIALLAVTGYVYSASMFYVVVGHIPIALNTAFCFGLLALGALAVRPAEGFMSPFTSQSAAGILARRMLPALVVAPPAIGYFALRAEQTGLFGQNEGISAMVVMITLLFMIVLWFTARELRRFAGEIEDLYNNAPCGYHSLDTNGVFVRVNDTELKWLGYEREEIVGRMSFGQLLTPASLESFKKNFPEFKERGEVHDLEFELTRKDGTILPVLLSATAIRDDAGNFIASRSTMVDLTQRRRMMENLQKARADAERANQAKSEFLANMSHEIRTPLTAIIGYVELLRDPAISPVERLNRANIVQRNSEHLLAIINDILDISKIEAGEMQPEIMACSPFEVIADVVSLMRPRAMEKGLAFNIEFGRVLPETIHSDPTRLRQILINLVGNAVKFTESGSVSFKASIEGAAGDNPRMRFDVIDTGIGMTPEEQSELFKPFSQADGSMTRRFGGTGLGLAISQRLASLLGGNIALKSTTHLGSTFTLTVATGPLDGMRMLTNCHEALLKMHDASDASLDYTLQLAGRILLVEDGADNRQLLAHYLREAGADVTCAENGAVACELVLDTMSSGEAFDLIVMDMQMPVQDGYDATRRLRAEGYTAPIIALTAHAMESDREKCIRAGCTDYLSKPVRCNALLTVIARHLHPDGLMDDSQQLDGQRDHAHTAHEAPDESIRPYIESFVRSMKDRIDELEHAMAEQDAAALSETLHRLKGSAGLFGFQEITEIAGALEDKVLHSRSVDSITGEVRELEEMMRQAAVPPMPRAGA